MNKVIEAIRAANETNIGKLKAWLRIPSVSTDSRQAGEVRRAGQFVLDELLDAGFEARMIDTDKHPIVTAEWLGAEGAPTVLFYGHYDVQPPEPLELWRNPPFEPTVEGVNLVARGATDDKGQCMAVVQGVGMYLRTAGRLPVNVKFLIEGEEEIGSPNLTAFIEQHHEALEADIALISDCSQFGPGVPAITVGLKGLCYVEVELQGANRDLHSGSFGGTVVNPGNALAAILGQLQSADGRVQIPGFYDKVVDLADEERRAMRELPFDEEAYRKDLDVDVLHGEPGYTTLERKGARPTLDVNGLLCGWTGEGAKTVLPARASAKFSMRLVANQDPAEIAEMTQRHLAELCPAGIRIKTHIHHGAEPILVPTDGDAMRAASRAITKGFGKEPVFMREGGSIPVVSTLKQVLGIDTILLGLGLPDDNCHSPNEKFNLDDYQRGIETIAHFLDELGA